MENRKVYPDTPFMGYKGSTKSKLPPDDWVYGPGAEWSHRPCLDCGGKMDIAKCPDQDERIRGTCLVFHGWHCTNCGGKRVNDEAFLRTMSPDDFKPSPGFFYCPYIPYDIFLWRSMDRWADDGGPAQ